MIAVKNLVTAIPILASLLNFSLAGEFTDDVQRQYEKNRLKDEMYNQRAELDRQRAELDKMKRQQQAQIDQMEAERGQVALDIQRQKNANELKSLILSMEQNVKSGQGLTDDEVRWLKAAGQLAKNYQNSEFRPYLARLYALYAAERARRGR